MTVPADAQLEVAAAAPGAPDSGPDTNLISRRRLVLRRFFHAPQGVIGLIVLAALVFLAFVGPHFSKYTYQSHDFLAFLQGPSSQHWFGTDDTGGDLYAQTLRGAQKSILVGLVAAVFATTIAAVVGSAAGYFGGWADRVLMWIVDLLLVVPSFLILAIVSNHAANNFLFFVVLLGVFLWQITARIVRGQTLALREREYVLAARYMGVPSWRIIASHIVPNLSSLLIIDATVNVSAAILTEASLSFFGFGVQPPDVSLGTLLSDAQNSASTYPWLFLFPAGFLVLLVLSVNLIGDGLRDALDPSSGTAQ